MPTHIEAARNAILNYIHETGNANFVNGKMIFLSIVMLVTGYLGETVYSDSAALWGGISGLAYFVIVYEIWLGSASKLAAAAGGNVLAAHKILCWFVLVGWAIYPLG